MNPLLIARQGIGGGALAVAMLGFVTLTPQPVQPKPTPDFFVGGGGSFKYRIDEDDDSWEIQLAIQEADDEEAVVTFLLMEIAKHVTF